jgi:hypothetical protein
MEVLEAVARSFGKKGVRYRSLLPVVVVVHRTTGNRRVTMANLAAKNKPARPRPRMVEGVDDLGKVDTTMIRAIMVVVVLVPGGFRTENASSKRMLAVKDTQCSKAVTKRHPATWKVALAAEVALKSKAVVEEVTAAVEAVLLTRRDTVVAVAVVRTSTTKLLRLEPKSFKWKVATRLEFKGTDWLSSRFPAQPDRAFKIPTMVTRVSNTMRANHHRAVQPQSAPIFQHHLARDQTVGSANVHKGMQRMPPTALALTWMLAVQTRALAIMSRASILHRQN